uniref:Small subunit ribosomal protein 5 n=1 Tax=Leucocytozoon caulleryi TaxID=211597 RepID=U3TU02_LEUCU|nr:small subunit ribosomal protein 5 [Leucocytozoon caulleryi]BAN94677.1 small subunit ribosomal protein 5 [Leucocytozoon caulleryi]
MYNKLNKKLVKLNYIYIYIYILILIKSLLIIFLKYNHKFINYYIYIYIILIYIKLYYYFINYKVSNIFIYDNNYIYFYIYKYYNYLLNYFDIKYNYNSFNIVIEKIIHIQKISYTVKKGRIKRYKVILVIGNKCGWIGIGISKNYNINKAIFYARENAFNNIYYFKYSLLNIYKLKYIFINIDKLVINIKINLYNYINIKFLLIKNLLECLGYLNCKILIYNNIFNNKINLLNKLLIVLFKYFN